MRLLPRIPKVSSEQLAYLARCLKISISILKIRLLINKLNFLKNNLSRPQYIGSKIIDLDRTRRALRLLNLVAQTTTKFSIAVDLDATTVSYAGKFVCTHMCVYEITSSRMVVQQRASRFTPILGHNDSAYGSRQPLIYLSRYYCSIHTYFSDESIV